MARFEKTYCSQCGCEFGPGDEGFSSCSQHVRPFYSEEELTKIYNTANHIPEGKAPPISTQKIFTAMRAMADLQYP
jgi:hypothetical protein